VPCRFAIARDMYSLSDMRSFFPNNGLYAILDSGYVTAGNWVDKATALLSGGASVLQVRAKELPFDEIRRRVQAVLPICARFEVPLVINDHLDLALEFPDAGLHLGQDDGDIEQARLELGPNRPLGLSTHSLEQAQDAIAHADLLSYFAVGPVFATQTKPDYPPVGLELVRQTAALQPPLPFFCIGGLHSGNAPEVLRAGACGLVAVSALLQADDTKTATATLVTCLSREAES